MPNDEWHNGVECWCNRRRNGRKEAEKRRQEQERRERPERGAPSSHLMGEANMHKVSISISAVGFDGVTDTELAARAASGDESAFVGIMRRHNRLLFRTARSILKSDSDADDALQEAYLRAWRALGSFRAEAKLSTWLVRIVINESLGRLRRRGAQVIPLETGADSDEHEAQVGPQAGAETDPDQQPERMAMRGEVRRLIEARIDRLPDAFRAVFMLRAVEELSVEETAVALEIPQATVRTRFFRARSLLREGLARDVDVAVGDAFSFGGARCDRIVSSVLAGLADDRNSPVRDVLPRETNWSF